MNGFVNKIFQVSNSSLHRMLVVAPDVDAVLVICSELKFGAPATLTVRPATQAYLTPERVAQGCNPDTLVPGQLIQSEIKGVPSWSTYRPKVKAPKKRRRLGEKFTPDMCATKV